MAVKDAAFFMQDMPLVDYLPINVGLTATTEAAMVSILGSPQLPLTTSCQNTKASPLVSKLKKIQKISDNLRVTGIQPSVDSLKTILDNVFQDIPELKTFLRTQGMLCVRYRKPTSGAKSTKISNHSWGTALDFNIVGYDAPGNTGKKIPRFIALMLPYFSKEGWFSGIAFHDSMHFEVSDEKIKEWSKDGLLKSA